jgi:hypothetical protein
MHYGLQNPQLDKHFLSIGLLGSCHELMDQIIILLHIQEVTKMSWLMSPTASKAKKEQGRMNHAKK